MTIQSQENKKPIEILRGIQNRYGDIDLLDMVYTHLMEEEKISQQRRIDEKRLGKFYPSSVGNCKRSVAYQMMGYPSSGIQGRSLMIMQNGTAFHDRMEKIFEKMGILIAPELSLKDQTLRISGRSDAIIWNHKLPEGAPPGPQITLYDPKDKNKVVYQGPDNYILIVELKSIRNKNFVKLKTKPLAKHIMQLQLYFYLTGIQRGILYYEDKDTQDAKHYFVDYNDELIAQVVEDIRYIIDFVERGELPEREGNALDIMCRYCNFRNICHTPINDEEWLDLFFDPEKVDEELENHDYATL